jgi:hypothetical protein
LHIASSPDEKLLAVDRLSSGVSNVWIVELAKNIMSRLTFNPSGDYAPVWSADGREVIFSSTRGAHTDLYRKAVGGGDEELLYHSDEDTGAYHSSEDGWILFGSGANFYQLPLAGERKPVAVLKSEFNEDGMAVSGMAAGWPMRLMNETSRYEVYVASYPSFTGRRQISNAGGYQPLWRADGGELFYLTLDGKLVRVGVKSRTALQTSVPRVLFQAPVQVNSKFQEYCVTGDGKRFIFRKPVGEAETRFTVVLNWTAELKR